MNKVGNILQEKREALGLSVDDVVGATKIQKIYLDAIEKGDLNFFKNQEFYQQVFVGSYADYLGLDKNEVLGYLQEDISVGAKPVESTKADSPQKVEISNEDLQNTKVHVVPNQESVEEPVVEPEKDTTVEDNEINQLIEEINQSIDVNVDDYFSEETTEPQVAEENKLNSAIFEQIEKINQDVEKKAEEQDGIEIETKVNEYQKDDDLLSSTAVIDLTSGIEIETVAKEEPISTAQVIESVEVEEIPNEVEATDIEIEQPAKTFDNPFTQESEKVEAELEHEVGKDVAQSYYEVEEAKKDNANILEELEKNINSAKDMQILSEDPEKTAMDIKIAKALGDSKAVLDEETSKKIKKDRIINAILFIVIIILIVFVVKLIFFDK